MRRLHVRGRENMAKRVLLQAAAFNLALILRSITRSGTPRGLADLTQTVLFALFRVLDALVACDAQVPRAIAHTRSSYVRFGRKPGF